jgi:DNA-binding MarR family transcriptional regulator
MNAFDAHPIYKKYDVCWNEDYLLGMVAFDEGLSTLNIMDACAEAGVMTPATTHKYIKQLLKKGLVKQVVLKYDRRVRALALTARGSHFLRDVK